MEEIILTNIYQTPITEELLSKYPNEVKEQFMDIVTTVPFINNLISPNRPKIEDLPRDINGRAIIDITNPPIFKDADYFRQAALTYLKDGCYTKLKPNSNPNSEFRKFWDKEIDRCYNGLLRKSDGMYIPGYMYWFLNYCPMIINKYKEGKKKAIRTEGFPYFFEGIWFRFLYLMKAREEGHHAVELAKRGAHPYDQKVFTPIGWRNWGDIKIGDELYGTYGNITKVIDIPIDKEFDWVYKIILEDGREVEATFDHLWNIELYDDDRSIFFNHIYTTEGLEILLNLGNTIFIPKINLKETNICPYSTNRIKINKVCKINKKVKCKCVTVDSNDHCYLIGDFVATHNCGKSYSLSSIMSHNLILGESKEANKRCITVLTAYQKEYLKDDKDGTFSKFNPTLSFLAKNTPFPRLMIKQSSNEMTWQMGYKDEYGRSQGSLNIVMGVSAKDDSDKLRGKRGYILFEEFGNFPSLLELYDVTRKSVEDGDYTFALMYLLGCVCAGTKVWTLDGRYINIEDLNKEDGIVGFTDTLHRETIHLNRGITKNPISSDFIIGDKECVKITLSNGNFLECSVDHPILIQKGIHTRGGRRHRIGYREVFINAKDLKAGDRVLEAREINIFGNDSLFDARLVGMLIGDGTYGSGVGYCSEDKELLDYVKSKYVCKLNAKHITKKGNQYEEIRINGIRRKLHDIGILGQTKQAKRLPENYMTLDRQNTILLLSGLYDTDGSITFCKKDYAITLTQSNIEILKQIQVLWRKFGIIGSISKTNPRIIEGKKDKNPRYTLTISGRYNCIRVSKVLDLLVPHKRKKLQEIRPYYTVNPSKKEQKYPTDIIMHKVIKVENLGIRKVYNLTAGLSHTYLANNIITHNTSNNKESNFQSAKTLLYGTESYNILSLPNVYDKKGQGKSTFGFFFPSYLNRAGCYNKDGISDVVKALLEILMNRYKSKYGADPTSVLRVIAEDPITPAEAIIKVKDAYFPVQQLTERAQELDTNPHLYDDIYVGELYENASDEIAFKPTDDMPIRKYPVDNDTKGALEIYSMPEKNSENKIFDNRYIIGVDPYDNDQAESHSLYSIFVLDLFTDLIVAEYTGRTNYANDAHEMVRKLCKFYNGKALYESNKKGLFAYMEAKHSTYMLADTPDYLRDKQLIRYSSFGSNVKGVNASAAINNYANRLIKDWLLKKIPREIKEEDGTTKIADVPLLYSLKNRALIEEAIQFSPAINVDRIRALGMLMLYREEYIIKYGDNLNKESREIVDKSDAEYDDFFTRNYDNRFIHKDSNFKFIT